MDATKTSSQPLAISGLNVSIARSAAGVPILLDIDLKVPAGQIVGLVGESGSGKSVLCLTAMGLLPQGWNADGAIEINGKTLGRFDEKAMRGVRGHDAAMIFQDAAASLNPIATIGSQLAETVRRLRGLGGAEARKASLELLRQVGIPDPERRFDEYPFQLSGGQNQRVLIALALAGRPRILFADEPTTALDVTVQAQILELISRLRHENDMGVVFVSHDLGVVANVCDEIAVMYAGRIVESGPTQEILDRARHPYTQGLIRSMPTKRGGRLYSIGGRVPLPAERPPGCAFAPRCPRSIDRCTLETPVMNVGATAMSRIACFNPADIVSRQGGTTDGHRPEALRSDQHELLQVSGASCDYEVRANRSFFSRSDMFRAVERVDLTIGEGEAIALIGESGSGKSTVAKLALGIEAPSEGSVIFDGQPVPPVGSKAHRTFTRQVQLVPQSPFAATDPRMRIGDQVREPLDIHEEGSPADRQDKVRSLLETVGLAPEMAARYPHEVSGGQLQRVVIARALALGPRMLICDEPTSALDVSVQGQIIELLKELRAKQHLALLFITHDLRIIRSLCDRVAVMYAGQIVEHAQIDDLFDKPVHPYTRDLLAAAPDLSERIELRRVPLQMEVPTVGCRYHGRCAWVTDLCRDETPPVFTTKAPDSYTRCHRAKEFTS